MIPGFIQRFLTFDYEYETPIEQQRAQLLYITTSISFVLATLWTVFITIPQVISGNFLEIEVIIPVAAIGVSGTLMWMVQQGKASWAAKLFVLFVFLATVPASTDINNPILMPTLIVPIVMTAVLLDQRILLLVTILIIAMILRGAVFANSEQTIEVSHLGGVIISIGLSSFILGLFDRSLEQLTALSARLLGHARQLDRSSHTMSDNPTRQELIIDAINVLRNRLGFSYIRVVLLGENQQATVTYYSSIGVEQVAQTTTFAFTHNSAFQHALDTLDAQLVMPRDLVNLSNHLLPASTAGVIIPAQGIGQTIALFDIQTEDPNGIELDEVALLKIFVSEVSTRLAYEQTVTALQDDIDKQEVLIEQQRQQILRIQNLQTEGISSDWENYLRLRGVDTIGYDIDNKRQLSGITLDNVPEELRPALSTGEVIVQKVNDVQTVTVPIRLRDNILGAMAFTVPHEIPITDRKIDFIRSVTERLALALDNKRLIEQTQTQAQRESTANEIGSVLLSSTDVESVLQTAADRFNEALGAITTQIYLQPTVLQSMDRVKREDTV